MASVRFTDVQARPTEFLDFTSLTLDEFSSSSRPLRPRSKPTWGCGASMGNPGLPAGLPCTRTAPCRRRKIGCSSFWPT